MQKHLSAFLTQTSEHTHPKEKIYVQALSVYALRFELKTQRDVFALGENFI